MMIQPPVCIMLSDARPSEDIYFVKSAAPQLLSRLGIDSHRINKEFAFEF